MKVKISNYPNWRFYHHWLYNWFGYAPKQKTSVKIHNYDTWSMDHTLAHIIVPMLVQLKATKHGAPWVDDEDVPEQLRSTSAPAKEDEYDVDSNHFKSWDWVIDEMIWAFEQKARDDWESDYYGEWVDDDSKPLGGHFINSDDAGRKAHQERMTNGFRLFCKYYNNLWD